MYYINDSTYKSFMMVIYSEKIARPEPLDQIVRPTQPSMLLPAFNGFPDAEIHYRASKCIQERMRRKRIVLFPDSA
ncbi:hypothetical protein MRX96_044668 [Rhipicephalus microplus]